MGNYFNNFFYPQQNLEQVVNTVSVPDKKQLHESVCLVNYVDGTTSVDSLLRGSKVYSMLGYIPQHMGRHPFNYLFLCTAKNEV